MLQGKTKKKKKKKRKKTELRSWEDRPLQGWRVRREEEIKTGFT